MAVANELERDGLPVIAPSLYTPELLTPEGVLTKRAPNPDEQGDIEYGWPIVQALGQYDIGQCLVVRKQMVIAVEAIEGTDRAIQRAVELAKAPVVVVKVAKPNQDQRFDIPTVGMTTLNSMLAPTPGGVLALEANETMVVEKTEMIEFCKQHQISMVAV